MVAFSPTLVISLAAFVPGPTPLSASAYESVTVYGLVATDHRLAVYGLVATDHRLAESV